MPSIASSETDLLALAGRLRIVAEAIKDLPADHTLFFEDRKALCKEVKEIAAQLRGEGLPYLARAQLQNHFP